MRTKNRSLLVYGMILMFLLSIVSPGLAAPNSSQPESASKITSAFADVTAQDSNLAFINYLSSRGIIKGFPDGTFHPTEGLTRAQAAAIVVLAGGVKADPALVSPFRDVPANHWSRTNIAAAVKAGYISGFPDKTFHPEEKLSRAQAASLILRLSKQPLSGAVLPQLSDLNSSHWAAPAVAVGIASGMLGLSADKKQVYPEQAMSRGDLARALGVLLTKDPDLSQAALVGKLNVKSGTVTVQSGSQEAKTVSGSSVIAAGDTITADKNAEADITYGDGSGLLLKGESQLIVKEARGRSYIKADGSAGIAIDWLLVDMKQGQLFGALATSSQVQESTASTEKKTTSYLGGKLLASLTGRDMIAAAPASSEAQVWYETSKTKKVKVKVDMPWGVAAIRGTFWNNMVNANGTGSTSILTGSGEVTAGGQTVSLSAMQATQVTAAGAAPVAAQTMTATQMSAWSQVATWAEARAEAIQQSQEASVQAPAVNATTTPAQTVISSIVQTINSAISAVQNAVSSATSTTPSSNSGGGNSGGGSSSSSSSSTTSGDSSGGTSQPATWRLEDVATTVYNSQTVALTRNLYITPPAGVSASSYYEVKMKNGSNIYSLGGARIGSPILHLAKASADPAKLFAVFRDNYDNRNAIYGLTGSGTSGTLTNLATKTISGKIDLQSSSGSGSVTAPAGGLVIKVIAKGDSIGGDSYFSQLVPITAGESTANYSISVPDNWSSGYDLYYSVQDSSYSNPFYQTISKSVNVVAGSVSEINMVMKQGAYIHGTLTLPAANPTYPSINGRIIAKLKSASGFWWQTFSIQKDESTCDYHIAVPIGPSYILSYSIDKKTTYANQQKFYPNGYYSSIGTVTDPVSAIDIPVTACVSGKDLAVQKGYGYLISGNVKLPSGDVAPANGIDMNGVYALSPGQEYSCYPYISSGQSSTEYAMNVASTGNYTLSLNKWGATPGITAPPLYKLDSVSAYVYGDTTLDLNLVSTGTVSGSTVGLDPGIISGPALLLGGAVYGLGGADYTAEIACGAGYSSWFYKSADGQWFNLRSFSTATALTATNATAVSNVPLIGIISGSPILTPSPSSLVYSATSRTLTITPQSGSGLWAAGDTVKAILMKEGSGSVVPGGPFTPCSLGPDTACVSIPSSLETGSYVLTLYKESGGVTSLLGVARFSINIS